MSITTPAETTEITEIRYEKSYEKSLELAKIKTFCIEITEILNTAGSLTEVPEVRRMCSVAITELQTAELWALKALESLE